MEMYNYPEIYEKAFSYRNFGKECSFIRKQLNKKTKSLLDIGCGAGQHLEILSKYYEIGGLDKSKKMVDYAKKKLKGNFYVRDMKKFSLPKKYDSAVSMLATFSYLVDIGDILSHFDSVSKVLNKKGIYMIEMGNPYVWFDVRRKTILNEWEVDNIKVKIVQHPPDFLKQTVRWVVHIKQGKHRIFSENTSRILFPQEFVDVVRMSKKFRIKNIFGDFKGKPFKKDSDRMIAVLEKF